MMDNATTAAAASASATLNVTKELNISFENLSYNAKVGFFKRHNKPILRNLNGEFKARELSVILGPSGSGKSTLLNLLSGYNANKNVSGMVKVNGSPRDPKLFRHTSSYVMQDSLLHPLLTVKEAMSFSSNLKIGKEMSADEKQKQINEILEILGLTETLETFTGKLSGGQQKRLSIALELVDNPRVIFFDEPTSGLDSSASTHCLSLLKRLAESGRTIICTVHQPSALLFQMFDNIYAIAEGQCIYQGSSVNLVPFLAEFDLVCPDTFNPCDYLLEISTHDYGYQINNLNQKIRDGLNQDYRKSRVLTEKQCDQQQFVQPRHETNPLSICVKKAKFSSKLQILDPKSYCNDSDLYSTSFLRQFYYLLIRTFLLITRNPSMCLMRIFIHLSVAIVIGCIYQGVGDSAKNQMNNFRYIFYSVMFLMFTAFSSLQTTFPLELPVIKREHFNRWYSVRAYYVALIIGDLPVQIFCTVSYILITYFMTSQPLEFFRFAGFFTINLLVCFVAQGIGMLVSSIFNVKLGTIFGTFFICPFLIFSGFFVQIKHAPAISHWLFHISFLKYALEGGVYTIFGFRREKLPCDDDVRNYCRYSYPNQLLRDIGLQDCEKNSTSLQNCDEFMYANQKTGFIKTVVILIGFTLLFRTVAYFIMRHRLKN